MSSSILFIVTSDPRTSHRPAEAIRIAAGLAAGQKLGVTVYLRAAAVLALSEFPDDLLDEDNYTRYLPLLRESAEQIYVEKNSAHLSEIGAPSCPYQELTDQALAEMAAKSDCVTRF